MHRRPAREQRRVASVVLLELSASNAPLDRRPAHNRIIQMNTAIESEKARPILHNVPIRDTHHSAHGRGRDEDCSSPPAQIPAGAANAPGSSLGSNVGKQAVWTRPRSGLQPPIGSTW